MPAHGRSQEFRGTISGVATDATGAVVPGAQVTVQEVRTGTVDRTTTNHAGVYVVPFLLPGHYTVTVAAAGFQKLVQRNILLQTQQHIVVNMRLKLGSISQTVTVTNAPPLLNVSNASVGSVIPSRSVEDLPLNGRTPITLAELAPGVISTNAPAQIRPFDNDAGNEWSIGGTPQASSEVLLDGSTDMTVLGAVAFNPSQGVASEVSVYPFDTDASFGHTSGGVINIVTKGGTNSFHGSLYEFGQISAINANTYFNSRSGQPTPTFHYNQYGLTFGGPVIIPKVFNGRNRLFFFFGYEGLDDSTPNTKFETIPTPAEKQGDFSQTLAAGCPAGFANDPHTAAAMCLPSGKFSSPYPDPNQLYNPFTAAMVGNDVVRQPILNNQLTSAGSLSSIAQAYLKLYPDPNNTSGAAADGENNYITNAPSADHFNSEFGRLDWNASSKDHVFFDIRHNDRFNFSDNYFGNGSTEQNLDRGNWGTSLDNIYTMNPTTIFDARLNWTFFNEIYGGPSNFTTPDSLGFPDYMTKASLHLATPSTSFDNFRGIGTSKFKMDPSTSYQIFVDMVKILGRHTLKVGFDGRQYRMTIQDFGDPAGSFDFDSTFVTAGTGAAGQNIGGGLADFEFGLPGGGDYDLNARADYHQYYVGTFIQDDWRVSDRLSLDLGLRYDVETPFREKYGHIVNGFNPKATILYSSSPSFSGASVTENGQTYTVATINTAGGLTFPGRANGAIYKNNGGFFSPRIGVSYMLATRTILHAGFGTFVGPLNLLKTNDSGSPSGTPINNQQGYSATTNLVASTDNNLTPAATLSDPFPNGFTQPLGDTLGANTFLGQSISFFAPYEHSPYSERWAFGIQQGFGNNTVLNLIYMGNHSLHLPISSHNLNAMGVQYLNHNPYLDANRGKAYGKSVANPFYNTLGTANTTSVNTSQTVSLSKLMGAFPQFGSSSVTEQNATIGQSYYQSAIVSIKHRSARGLTLRANYSFSKLIEADTFLNDVDTIPYRRISPFDHTNHLAAGATYSLPFGSGRMFSLGGSRLWNEVLGGWVVNGIYKFESGEPVNFSDDIPLQPNTSIRQISVKSRNSSPVGSGDPALSTARFVTGNSTSCPAQGACDGTTFINGQYKYHYRTLPEYLSWVRSDSFNNLDASILKRFHLASESYVELRFETFNTLNHPIFSAPETSSATSSSFGYITDTEGEPRQIQVGARLVF